MFKTSIFRQFFQNDVTAQQSPELTKIKAYRRIAIRSVYLQRLPLNQAICCIDCGSKNIKEWGLLKRDDHKRVHSCNDCGQILYRTIDRLPIIKQNIQVHTIKDNKSVSLASC